MQKATSTVAHWHDQRPLPHQVPDIGVTTIFRLARHFAVTACDVDLLLADARQGNQCREREQEGDQEHRAARQQISGGAHHGGGDAIADGGKTGVAPKPFADRERADETKADRCDRRPQHTACSRMQRSGRHHHGEDRHGRIGERAAADGRDRKPGNQPLGFRSIDDRAAWHLPDQGDDAADRQHKADLDLGPFLRR
jgi:hypothetical protein